MLDPAFKAEWTTALRSRDYQQGMCQLRNVQNQFCCLGVACDLVDPTGWRDMGANFYRYDDRCSTPQASFMPTGVMGRIGLEYAQMMRLVALNDDQKSFDYIAKWIDTNL